MTLTTAQQRADWREHGVVCLPQALPADALEQALALYDWSLANPTGAACEFYPEQPGRFYQDLCHPRAAIAYRSFLEQSVVADILAELWNGPDVWFLYEQIFLKDGAEMRRTPWHQDAPYLALDGERIAVVWINFDPVEKAQSLEFVRGSHRGTLYDGSSFDSGDDTAPIYDHGLPRLPDIEAARADFDIVSFGVTPGDIVVFHPAVLHGGAPTRDGVRRRTLSLRYFGEDVVYAARPNPAVAPITAGLHETLKPGETFRFPAFPRLRPAPDGFDAVEHIAAQTATDNRLRLNPTR